MPTLLETERRFAAAILSGDDHDAAQFVAAGNISAGEAIAIYRNTCISGATRALRLTFPAIERLTGPDFFEAAAAEFIASHPPRSGCLDDYGDKFPQFLAAFTPAAALPYLADVAKLEWAVNTALRAANVAPLSANNFSAAAGVDPARLILRPHPSLSTLRSLFPADTIWRAVLEDDEAAMAAIRLDQGPVNLIVARGENGVETSRLTDTGWRFLSSLCAGRTLAESLDMACTEELAQLLAESITQGRFVAFGEIHS